MDAQDALQRLDVHISDIDADIARLNGTMLLDEEIDARIARMDASRARLAAMRSSMSMSCRSIQRDAFITANSRMPIECANIPGDIPTLMRSAFTHEFGEVIPDDDGEAEPATADEVASALAALDLHHRSAIDLVNRVTAILTRGPQLSMNIPLAPGEDLPPRIFTLLQGTIWALLVEAGANPDIQDRLLTRSQAMYPDATDLHNKIRKALTPEAKCLWFLCRKFFFTLNVAEKDGERYQCSCSGYYHHHMYMGRLFMLVTTKHTALTRARMPRALEIYSNWTTLIARTPKVRRPDPSPTAPKVAEREASLPAWDKYRMVTYVSLKEDETFILTPFGTVVAGASSNLYVGPVERENSHLFHPVAVPYGFVPDHIMHAWNTVILSMGDQRCQLNDMSGFVDLPFRVDRIIAFEFDFDVFLSGRQLLFAGRVTPHIAQSGMLHGYSEGDKCLTATPLRFRERVKGFLCEEFCCDQLTLAWVTEGRTHLCDNDKQFCVPFETTAAGGQWVSDSDVLSFRDTSGQWFYAKTVSDGVAELVECEAPRWSAEIIPVDLDPWTQD
ncbi:hypothetical protein J8273_3538 [Carpediemonas membranifera]|uniref:Uncharacterized protein n=1 Tax=Carpediemonas membranifera TaxID=201153 RepID=A0A8J6BAM3_9EUKA|nr:hypothetical protein J8273_3538 [Carpediemonas membranifera]|eukprot:KAG9393402.1 hypothetical protein J8273_3538 [Carpediemonas membranifera]